MPLLNALDTPELLRLITDCIHDDDALCAALSCLAMRASVLLRFKMRRLALVQGRPTALLQPRLKTHFRACFASVARLNWALTSGNLPPVWNLLFAGAARYGELKFVRLLLYKIGPRWDEDFWRVACVWTRISSCWRR